MQSGSDTVLKRMNRRYDSKEYEQAVRLIREYYPDPAITTDVIVGFPDETEEEFLETKNFLEKIKLYETHIFKYSPRQGTKAVLLGDKVSKEDKNLRSSQLIDLSNQNKLDYHNDTMGKNLEVLFETSDDHYYYGHTKNYIKVAVPKTKSSIINEILLVEAIQVKDDMVIGRHCTI